MIDPVAEWRAMTPLERAAYVLALRAALKGDFSLEELGKILAHATDAEILALHQRKTR